MDGVEVIENSGAWICRIHRVSDELKTVIRERLSEICHGTEKANRRKAYQYSATLQEFLKRYRSKKPNTKMGMIGELLSHLLLFDSVKHLKPSSPFFNMEETSIKKGFDLVAHDKNTGEVWVTEVKSGATNKQTSHEKKQHF